MIVILNYLLILFYYYIYLLPIKNIPLLLHDCFDKVRES